ncbi:hypothetical protein AB0O75_47430 [Streptomyces sp. NPDC088921]|uniref:hypothetical protein n=1 Tax=unclassified Streptomyces TaxID=2593676 RepID=UPI0034354396
MAPSAILPAAEISRFHVPDTDLAARGSAACEVDLALPEERRPEVEILKFPRFAPVHDPGPSPRRAAADWREQADTGPKIVVLDTGAEGPDHLRLIVLDQVLCTLRELRAIVLRRQAEALR